MFLIAIAILSLSLTSAITTKVFNLGMPKSGSSTIHEYFLCHNYTSFHWNTKNPNRYLSSNYGGSEKFISYCIDLAVRKNVTLLELENYPHCQIDFDALSQMDSMETNACSVPQISHVKWLDKTYPKSKFIIPIRPVDDWIKSVKGWGLDTRLINCIEYLNITKVGNSTDEILGNFYDWHYFETLKYFKGRSGDLIIIDLYEHLNNDILSLFLGLNYSEKCFGIYNQNKNIRNQNKTPN
jgi:hypothetical protein